MAESGGNRSQSLCVCDVGPALALTGLERKQKAFLRTHPSVSSPGDSRRPKFLPKTHTCACVTASLAPASVLSSASPPSLFHSSLPCFPFLFLLLSRLLSSVSPHPTPCRLPSSLSPALHPPMAAAAHGPELRSVCSVSPLCPPSPPLPPTRRGRSWPRDGGTWRPARRSTPSSRRSSITAPSQCGNSYRSS